MTSPLSPCVKICVVDPLAGLCIGCGRTVGEISLWPEMAEAERARRDGRTAGAHGDGALARRARRPRARPRRVRALAPLALLLAALAALWLTPPGAPLLGLSHDDFARGSLGVSVLLWLTVSGVARAGPSGAARVLSGRAVLGAGRRVAGRDLRLPLRIRRDRRPRVMEELGPSVARVGPGGEVVVRRRLGGEFIVPGTVNGRAVAFVFDTGASSVVLTAEDAAAAGVRVAVRAISRSTSRPPTASTTAAPARLGQIAVGGIVVRDVPALVAQPGTLQPEPARHDAFSNG